MKRQRSSNKERTPKKGKFENASENFAQNVDFKNDQIKTREVVRVLENKNNYIFFGYSEHFQYIRVLLNVSTSNGCVLNSHQLDLFSMNNVQFDTFVNNKRRRSESLELFSIVPLKDKELALYDENFTEKRTWNFVDSILALEFLEMKKTEELSRKRLQIELEKTKIENINLLRRLSGSCRIHQKNLQLIRSEKSGFSGNIEEIVNFIILFGITIIIKASLILKNFSKTYKNNEAYEKSNKVIVVVSSTEKVGQRMSSNSLVSETIEHWKEMRDIDEKSKILPEGDFSDGIMCRLKNFTLEHCPGLRLLMGTLIRDGGEESKGWKTMGLIHSILGSWNKTHRYFARQFMKWTIPLGIPESMYILLNNLFGICYRKKVDESIKVEVVNKRERARKVRKNEALFTSEDNVSKSPAYGNFRKLFHFTTKIFWKLEVPKDLMNLKNLFFKKRVKYSDVRIIGYARSAGFIESCSKRGIDYCVNERERLEKRRKGEVEKANPPEIFVEDLIPMPEGFTHKAMAVCVKNSFSVYEFEEEEEEENRIPIKVACGDFQYYVQMCREYRMGNVIIWAGHLHYRMSFCDCIWTIFRTPLLLHINYNFDFKCPYKFSSSRFCRFHLIIKHTLIAVNSILDKVTDVPDTKEDILKCVNKALSTLVFFRLLGGLYFYLEMCIRNRMWSEVAEVWDILQSVFYYAKKKNYSLLNLSQRIRRKCLIKKVRIWLDKVRGVCFNHKDAVVDMDCVCEYTNDPVKKTLLKESDIDSFVSMAAIYGNLGMNYSRSMLKWLRRRKHYINTNAKNGKRKNLHEKSSTRIQMYLEEYLFSEHSYETFSQEKIEELSFFERKKMSKFQKPSYHMKMFFDPSIGDFFTWQRKKVDFYNKKKSVFEDRKIKETDTEIEEVEEEVNEEIPLSEMFDFVEYDKQCQLDDEFVPDFEDDEEEILDLDFEIEESLK